MQAAKIHHLTHLHNINNKIETKTTFRNLTFNILNITKAKNTQKHLPKLAQIKKQT